MLEAIRTVTDKPVKPIVYGHSRTVAGGAPAFYPEVGPYLTARALTQFNAYMPAKGPDPYVLPTNLTAIA
jgi:hypothetical protein